MPLRRRPPSLITSSEELGLEREHDSGGSERAHSVSEQQLTPTGSTGSTNGKGGGKRKRDNAHSKGQKQRKRERGRRGCGQDDPEIPRDKAMEVDVSSLSTTLEDTMEQVDDTLSCDSHLMLVSDDHAHPIPPTQPPHVPTVVSSPDITVTQPTALSTPCYNLASPNVTHPNPPTSTSFQSPTYFLSPQGVASLCSTHPSAPYVKIQHVVTETVVLRRISMEIVDRSSGAVVHSDYSEEVSIIIL